jgi:hypothetical protein
METQHYLRFARVLALISGASACGTAAGPGSDVVAAESATDTAVVDTVTPTDTAAPPDVAQDVPRDVTGPDVVAMPDVVTMPDVVSPTDVATGCPTVAPMNGSACDSVGQMCTWSAGLGAPFTSCECTASTSTSPHWQCFTAIPGPLPPPELAAA